ncbi:MAG: hypothetical protein CM15mL4_3020 [uncultured marine virus]|nr:MAG: hypothetical protein CM15mL4_3020 [uncultured marine virus]
MERLFVKLVMFIVAWTIGDYVGGSKFFPDQFFELYVGAPRGMDRTYKTEYSP